MRVAYLVSRFPKTTETFIANEILGLIAQGHEVIIHSLITETDQVIHPGVEKLLAGVRYGDRDRVSTLLAAARWAVRRPMATARLLRLVVGAHARQPGEMGKYLWQHAVACRWATQLRHDRVDMVHAHWATYPAYGAMVIGAMTGLPFTFTGHAHDIQLPNPTLPAKIEAAAAVVTISEYNRRLLQKLAPTADPRKIEIVHCGVDVAAFASRAAARRPATSNAPGTIVCVGALVPYKGQRVLVEACAQLKLRNVELRCRIVGDGEDRQALAEQIARLEVSDHVELVGRLPADRVAEELAAASVMVLPSVVLSSGQMEGIPVALMEAMAAGVPVISTRISGIPELVVDGETGLLVEPDDATALADAIESVLTDPAGAERRAVAGSALVAAQFDQATEVTRLVEIFARAARLR
ncbi:MAG: glycosyltransferase family 4 protein [Acidimicrobiia bacterium]